MLGLNWIKKDMFSLLITQLAVPWFIKLYIECTLILIYDNNNNSICVKVL